jgi:hypothetical protein
MYLVSDRSISKLKYIADVSDYFVPIDVPDGTLDLQPLTLRTWFLTLSILLFASCMAGVITTIYLHMSPRFVPCLQRIVPSGLSLSARRSRKHNRDMV